MATPQELLSTKNAEKQPKIKKNPEDQEPKEVGGPEADWTTADYAKMKFDATVGVKPDTTILPKAQVKGEPMPKLKTVKEEKDGVEGDEDEARSQDFDESVVIEGEEETVEPKDDEESEEESEEESGEESEEESSDEMGDDDLSFEGEDEDEKTPEEAEESVSADELELQDLTDDADVMELGDDDEDEDEGVHVDINSHDVKEAGQDYIEPDLFKAEAEDFEDEDEDESEDEDEELGSVPGGQGDHMEAKKMYDETAMDGMMKAMPMPVLKKSMKESKIRVSFKVKEASKLFESNSVLSEEDKRQSRSLFEGAVRSAVKQVGKQIHEAYKTRFSEVKKLHEARIAKQMDAYLSYVVEQWAKQNEVALRAQLRHRLSENLLKGMKDLFTQHYVDIPESKINVVEALTKKVKGLNAQLKEAEVQSVKMHTELKEAVKRERKALIKEHRARLISEAAATVTPSQRGKFAQQAESIRFTGSKNFKKDLVALREQYFVAKKTGERPLDVPDAEPLFENTKKRPTAVDQYAKVLDKLTEQQ